jgi:hypothetical protein
MSRPGVVLLITTGVVIANHCYGLPSAETQGDLTEITRISIAPDRDYRSSEIIPTFAPSAQAARQVISDDTSVPAAQPPPKPGTWTTVVTAGRSVVSPVRSSRPADPATRAHLAEDLQRELQRVGCYQGEITGSWNAATRHAMSAFMDRANAVLPFNQPDYVLLALVQSHREVTCAAECPAGQTAQDDGRCVPAAVIAQASKRQKRREARELAAARLAEKRANEEARDRVAVSSPPSQPEVLPWLRNPVVVEPLTEVATAPRPDLLPGRMSIGGPQPPPDVAQPAPAFQHTLPPVVSAPTASAKFAALQADPDADDLTDGVNVGTGDVPAVTGDSEGAKVHKTKKARHGDREGRRQREYSSAYSGRRRHGDPRPGTARFNLMQSLGGIY